MNFVISPNDLDRLIDALADAVERMKTEADPEQREAEYLLSELRRQKIQHEAENLPREEAARLYFENENFEGRIADFGRASRCLGVERSLARLSELAGCKWERTATGTRNAHYTVDFPLGYLELRGALLREFLHAAELSDSVIFVDNGASRIVFVVDNVWTD